MGRPQHVAISQGVQRGPRLPHGIVVAEERAWATAPEAEVNEGFHHVERRRVGRRVRPAGFADDRSTSGKLRNRPSRCFRSSAAWVTPARGTVIGMSSVLPSSRAGMKVTPILGK